MSDIEKQVKQQKREYDSEQQRIQALRKRKPAPGKRLEHYVELERGDLRRDAKLAEAGKQSSSD